MKLPKLNLGRFAVELIVVFLGVYGAFWVAEFQENLRDHEIQAKYYASLIYEFEVLLAHLHQEEGKLGRHLTVIEEIEQGARPNLPPMDIHYAYRGDVVRAAFNSQYFESLEYSLLRNIISGVPALEALEHRVATLNQLAVTVLEPMRAANAHTY